MDGLEQVESYVRGVSGVNNLLLTGPWEYVQLGSEWQTQRFLAITQSAFYNEVTCRKERDLT